jgi:photoactive yellow protein
MDGYGWEVRGKTSFEEFVMARKGSGVRGRSAVDSRVGSTVCVWCHKVIVERAAEMPVSHGICLDCMVEEHPPFPLESIESMTHAELNQLPFGAIRITADGTILDYNDSEAALSHRRPADVIGKNFFTEVAPCTRVAEFYGEFEKLKVAGRSGQAEFSFVFRFAKGAALVDVVLLYEADTGNGTILVKVLRTEMSE